MNIVMIIPTGLGATIGGNAGDANPIARLIGKNCNILVTHPNVVNGSDINEMTENTWYVEGSILDRFLQGEINLEKPKTNKLLVAVNAPARPETINAVSAARATLGVEAEMVELNSPLTMIAKIENGMATGTVEGVDELVNQIKDMHYDALALATPITVPKDIAENYLKNGGVNPWGGVEAKASKLIADKLNKPVAHSPVETEEDNWLEQYAKQLVVNPTIAPEMISMTFLFSVMKGLHKAPRIGKGLSNRDVDLLISPYGCWGRPHKACWSNKIPIIIVKNNKVVQDVNSQIALNFMSYEERKCIMIENYLEAVGVIQAIKEGISIEYFFRPIEKTKVL